LYPICGENLHNGEALETHHKVPLVKNGTNEIDNLQHLHKICVEVHGVSVAEEKEESDQNEYSRQIQSGTQEYSGLAA
jgi:hypothetical protein